MNFGQMQARVQFYVRNRPGLIGTIKDMINEEAQKLAMPFEFPLLSVEQNVVVPAETFSYTFTGTLEAILGIYDITNGVPLNPQDLIWYAQQSRELSFGYPRTYVLVNNELRLMPQPSMDLELLVFGKRFPDELVDDGDELELPLDWHTIVCKLAASELLFGLGEDQKGMSFKNAALADISARQEIRTIELRAAEGRMVMDRSKYTRGMSGSRPQWR